MRFYSILHGKQPVFKGEMPRRLLILLIIAVCLSGVISGGCDNAKETASFKTFAVEDSLLGAAWRIGETDKIMRIPAGFVPAPDSVLQLLQATVMEQFGTGHNLELQQCFINNVNMAGLLVAKIGGFVLLSDTARFFASYRESLYDVYGREQITEDNYLIDSIVIKKFFINGETTVHAQMIALSESGDAIEFDFFCPRPNYSHLAAIIDAATGSLRVSPQSDE